jgi:hypothetical protein
VPDCTTRRSRKGVPRAFGLGEGRWEIAAVRGLVGQRVEMAVEGVGFYVEMQAAAGEHPGFRDF